MKRLLALFLLFVCFDAVAAGFAPLVTPEPRVIKGQCSYGLCAFYRLSIQSPVTSAADEIVIPVKMLVGYPVGEDENEQVMDTYFNWGKAPPTEAEFRSIYTKPFKWRSREATIEVRCSYSTPQVRSGERIYGLFLRADHPLPDYRQDDGIVYFAVCHSDFALATAAKRFGYWVVSAPYLELR